MNIVDVALQGIIDTLVDKRKVFGASFAIKNEYNHWEGTAGDLSEDRPFFIASVTKLFTAAIIFHLRDNGLLHLSDTLDQYFSDAVLKGLHTHKGIEYAANISIQQLLAHTSGLPDYFQGKSKDKNSLQKALLRGVDRSWSFDDVISMAKSMSPAFFPSQKSKAYYADTNYQILGKVIETITGLPFAAACKQYIMDPLNLSQTYVYIDSLDTKPNHIYYKHQPLHIPNAMASFGPDGGIVSIASELRTFIEAFFNGALFNIASINKMQQWNKIFFPLQAGIGMQRFQLPWILNPTASAPTCIGHAGLSGAIAFYIPSKKIYIAGTVNQAAHPNLAFQTMIKLYKAFS